MEEIVNKYSELFAKHKEKEEYYKSEEFRKKYVDAVLPTVLANIAHAMARGDLVTESQKIHFATDERYWFDSAFNQFSLDVAHRPEYKYLYCFEAYDRAQAVAEQLKEIKTTREFDSKATYLCIVKFSAL